MHVPMWEDSGIDRGDAQGTRVLAEHKNKMPHDPESSWSNGLISESMIHENFFF